MEPSAQVQESPPETFVKQVKDALENLYDFPYLQRHPLVQESAFSVEHPSETPSQRLRRELIAAIETLNPGPGVSFRAPYARLYTLLLLHYVEGMTVQEASHELGISRRQAHRDLRRGEESVAMVVWVRRYMPRPEELSATQVSSVQAEVARLEYCPHPTDMRLLLQHAQEAVERMASQRGVTLDVRMLPEPVIVSTNPVVARQVLINTLSQAVGQAHPGTLYAVLAGEDAQASFTLRYFPEAGAVNALAVNPIVVQLADQLGWTVSQKDHAGGTRTISLYMAARCPTVLVIDDNEGLVELLKDYLIGHACRVMSATSSQEGLRLAQEAVPDAIVLDVMMPEMDGWELLQRLRNHRDTAEIPVVICSVINSPELAYSLGASHFLSKPVSRDDVLNSLYRLGVF